MNSFIHKALNIYSCFCFVLYIEVPKIKWFESDLLYQGSANYQPGPLSIFINNFYWNTVMHVFYVLSMAAFETFLDSKEAFTIETGPLQ